MHRLVFGMVRCGERDGGEDVGGKRRLRRRIIDRFTFAADPLAWVRGKENGNTPCALRMLCVYRLVAKCPWSPTF